MKVLLGLRGKTRKVRSKEKISGTGWTLTAVDPDEEARNTLITILLQYVLKRMQQVAS